MKPLALIQKTLCVAALVCVSAVSSNANPIANPGFETGNFAGWTVNDPSGFTGVGMDPAFAHSGNHYAFLGATPNIGVLSQNVATMAGSTYTLSFWLANDITTGTTLGPLATFSVFFNGISVFTLPPSSPAFPYTQIVIPGLVATGPVTSLEFKYRHDNDFYRLDDVALNVPEAGSALWMALPVLAAFGLLHMRRPRKAAVRA